MINPGDEEYPDDFEQGEPQGGSPELDYKSEYEKTKAEMADWQQKYQRRDADYRAQHGQLKPAQVELARLKKLEDSWKKKTPETPAEWNAYREEFPIESKAIELRYSPMQQRMEEIAQENAEIKQRLAERDRTYQIKDAFTRVTTKHPDFMDIVGSKEFSEFGMTLPRAMRTAFEDRENPDDEVHIMVLDLFKEKYANSQKPNAKKEYVQSQGVAPRAKQTQSGSASDGSNDPAEQQFLQALDHAKKSRRN